MRQNRASNIATLDMILPVYSNRMRSQSLEEREHNIEGWVFSSFDIATLMGEIFQQEVSQLAIRITDISDTVTTQPVYPVSYTHLTLPTKA